jgi:RNase adapter protein RapZ
MSLIIVSGLSGAGKSVAMHALEDLGFNCVDNLPIRLLNAFIQDDEVRGHRTAVSLDARNPIPVLRELPEKIAEIREQDLDSQVLFLEAVDDVLMKRFSETRRKHPLTGDDRTLLEAITLERELLHGVRDRADSIIDTTLINLHQLRDLIRQRVGHDTVQSLTLLFESFGFKHGVPAGADLVFDARCLPNPYWEPSLRGLTGRDIEVQRYLGANDMVQEMIESIRTYLDTWIPRFEADNRAYLTVTIGCTGGQHRSVFLVEHLAKLFSGKREDVIARHRQLDGKTS